MEKVTVHLAETKEEIRKCMNVRRLVFQEEQGILPSADVDGFDFHPNTFHIGAKAQCREYVGALRGRLLPEPNVVKLERMAVLADFRGSGIGLGLIAMFEVIARFKGRNTICAHVQAHAKNFYKKCGFIVAGEQFYEAGILHVPMRKIIKKII